MSQLNEARTGPECRRRRAERRSAVSRRRGPASRRAFWRAYGTTMRSVGEGGR